MTKSQINKLGDHLRHEPLDEVKLARLQEFRARFSAPMLKVQTALSERMALETTARLKTVNTTIGKLRRDQTRLAEVQDIAGVRIVGDWTLDEQDAIVAQIVELFPGARVHDRRRSPSHGYRAVHVIPVVDDCSVEIPVRTHVQDGWAQTMEKLADIVGREIRYGGMPAGEDAETLKLLVNEMLGISQSFAIYETFRTRVREVRAKMAVMEAAVRDGTVTGEEAAALTDRLDRMRARMPEVDAKEKEASEVTRRLMADISALVDGIIGGEGRDGA